MIQLGMKTGPGCCDHRCYVVVCYVCYRVVLCVCGVLWLCYRVVLSGGVMCLWCYGCVIGQCYVCVMLCGGTGVVMSCDCVMCWCYCKRMMWYRYVRTQDRC